MKDKVETSRINVLCKLAFQPMHQFLSLNHKTLEKEGLEALQNLLSRCRSISSGGTTKVQA